MYHVATFMALTNPKSVEPDLLLAICSLSVRYCSRQGPDCTALEKVDLAVHRGEIIGILGESGSGKSTLAAAVLGLLVPEAKVSGSIIFDGRDLARQNNSELRSVRGCGIAMVHQDASLSLNPVLRVGAQIEEVIRAHKKMRRADRVRRAKEALGQAQIPDVERVYGSYPHQLSGGERLRVTIAQAIVCGPRLLIADEPTSALDATIQASVLNTFRDLQRDLGMAILFITHDPAVLAGLAQRVVILHAGRIVEQGPVSQVYSRPQHPYSQELVSLMGRASQVGA